MAKKIIGKRVLVLLTTLAVSYVLGKCGHPTPGQFNGFWDGPVGG